MTQAHNKIKRIVILTQDYFPMIGGITTWCYEYARAFSRMGFEVIVIAPDLADRTADQNTDMPADSAAGFKVRRLNHTNWKNRKNFRIYSAIKHLIDQQTVFLCANWKMAVPCMLHSLKRDIQYFTAVHGLDAFETRKINRALQGLALVRGDGVMPVSNYTLDLVQTLRIPADKLCVINNGVDLNKFPLKTRDSAIEKKYGFGSQFRLLSISRLHVRKGFDMTIRALPLIKHPLVYFIGGTGDYRLELEQLARELGVRDRVKFLGFVPDAELADVYTCADLFCMPSRHHRRSVEGFGIVYLEAAACAVPSIAGRGSGAGDAVLDGTTGYLVDPESPEAIAAAINAAIESGAGLKEMGLVARRRVEKSFTWDILARQMLNFMHARLGA